MKKILILTSRYLPNPSANGLVTNYIVNEMTKRGYNVTCLSIHSDKEAEFEEINNIKIHRITPSRFTKIYAYSQNELYSKFVLFLRKIKQLVLLPLFPNFDPLQTNKVFKKVRKLHQEENFDCIIGVFKPYSNIGALKKIKKKNPDLKVVGYFLDLFSSMRKPSFMPSNIYSWLIFNENKKVLKKFDICLVAIGGKKMFENIKEKKLMDKLFFVDFPTFTNHKKSLNKTEKSKSIVMTYAGTLDTTYRNPELLLKTLNRASEYAGSIVLNVYGKNNCTNLFELYKSDKFRIINHGIKKHEVVIKTMQASDFVINVSNVIQDAVPSKIFELFSLGRPIINLTFDKEDITSTYFSKYPLVHTIKAWDEIKSQQDNFNTFLRETKGIKCDVTQIKELYKENTPEYTVDIIENII